MKKNLLSKVASDSASYLFSKKPSTFIPFKGKFPILDDYLYSKWQEEFEKHAYLEDCSEWFQESVAKARRMSTLENGFREYLHDTGDYDNFTELDASEKADLLVKFLNKNNLTIEYLKI